MSELGVGPDDAVLKVVCFTNEGTWVKLEETPLPPPLVVGPSFTSTTAEISKTAGGKSDVKAVQAKLTTGTNAWNVPPRQTGSTRCGPLVLSLALCSPAL